ncbi:MAG: GmrSD restriction endonuclease domain-containing protein [Brachybacterium tyrofermentans]|uniref:GmrSD restriction endonuclease domain-containing protein n=1 Tax=Brachybacterium tyrofermentans TaxID=47848 RepID=UPI003F8DD04E
MPAIFKTVSWQVDQLVSGVQQGSISLPDLQRPFVWPATKVRDLFDSMYRGYPVGTLMFWDVSEDDSSRSISGSSTIAAAHQIVDGQQRLTSLYAAMKGLEVQDDSYRRKSIKISFHPYTERFEVATAATARSAEWINDIATVFHSPYDAQEDFLEGLEAAGRELTRDDRRRLGEVFKKLEGLKQYQFEVVHIQKDVDKRLVADVFVRINSEGMNLKAYDYILTWLSVFWPDGRDQIEGFARASRMTPERATEIEGKRVSWTPKNPYLAVETGHVVRAMVAIGQNRAKLIDAYANLQAKDRATGQIDGDKQERELEKLRQALPIVTDRINWTEFIRSIQIAGFRSHAGITSNMNIVASYVMFLLGRTRYSVELTRLRTLIARWFFMSQLTGRYTGSSESQIQKDLDMFAEIGDGDADGFADLVDQTIAITVTNDFWEFNVPQSLVSSSYKLSPVYQCYLASLNYLDADMFMLRMKVREWMDPALPAIKGLEGHHLVPRHYQESALGTTDTKRINQVANFAPTDWHTNVQISDRAPAEYWPELVRERGGDAGWMERQHYWHALPEQWHLLSYEDFLARRRKLIATVTRDAFEKLGRDGYSLPLAPAGLPVEAAADETSLATLVDEGFLMPGDQLDPVDPDWVVDAIVTEDGTIQIDGVHEFDSLDEAARFLEVTNVSGFEFWALEQDGGLAPLADVVAVGPRAK